MWFGTVCLPGAGKNYPEFTLFFFSRYCIRQPIRHTLGFRSLWTTFELIYNLIQSIFPRNLLSKAMSLFGLGLLSKLDVAFILLPQKAKHTFFFFSYLVVTFSISKLAPLHTDGHLSPWVPFQLCSQPERNPPKERTS